MWCGSSSSSSRRRSIQTPNCRAQEWKQNTPIKCILGLNWWVVVEGVMITLSCPLRMSMKMPSSFCHSQFCTSSSNLAGRILAPIMVQALDFSNNFFLGTPIIRNPNYNFHQNGMYVLPLYCFSRSSLCEALDFECSTSVFFMIFFPFSFLETFQLLSMPKVCPLCWFSL
jgi:hypothetical protein